MRVCGLILAIVAQIGALLDAILQTLAPPRRQCAHAFRLQHKALCLHDVEEELADHVGVARVGHLQARPEPLRGKGNTKIFIIDVRTTHKSGAH